MTFMGFMKYILTLCTRDYCRECGTRLDGWHTSSNDHADEETICIKCGQKWGKTLYGMW